MGDEIREIYPVPEWDFDDLTYCEMKVSLRDNVISYMMISSSSFIEGIAYALDQIEGGRAIEDLMLYTQAAILGLNHGISLPSVCEKLKKMITDQVLERKKDQITEEEYKELLSDLNEVTTKLGITPQD